MKNKLLILMCLMIASSCTMYNRITKKPGNPTQNAYCKTAKVKQVDEFDDDITGSLGDALRFRIEFHFLHSSAEDYMLHDHSVSLRLIDEINENYEGYMIFEGAQYDQHIIQDINIDELMASYGKRHDKWKALIGSEPYEEDCIYVYVVPGDGELLGFTPVYVDWHKGYQEVTPKMDYLCISHLAASGHWNTLTHELGHFFGLSHVFEQTKDELIKNGVTAPIEYCVNIMNYNCYTDRYTPEQIGYQVNFAAEYRPYLIR